MSGEEDDKATVVIDISALRKEKEKKEKEIADLAGSLEFSVEPAEPAARKVAQGASAPVVFFEFGGHVFSELKSLLPAGSVVLNDLSALNERIKKKTPLVVVFAFDTDAKSVNQLCAQLKTKFKHVRTVIAAKKLSPEKVKMHQASPAGADAYLPIPFTKAELNKALLPLTAVKAS